MNEDKIVELYTRQCFLQGQLSEIQQEIQREIQKSGFESVKFKVEGIKKPEPNIRLPENELKLVDK